MSDKVLTLGDVLARKPELRKIPVPAFGGSIFARRLTIEQTFKVREDIAAISDSTKRINEASVRAIFETVRNEDGSQFFESLDQIRELGGEDFEALATALADQPTEEIQKN